MFGIMFPVVSLTIPTYPINVGGPNVDANT
jgi:hypothetical protein